MPRYDVFLEGRTENSTCYFGVAVMADDQKEAEFLGHEAGRVKHQECDEIEVVGVMPVISARNAGKGRLCQRIPLKERALKFVKETIKKERQVEILPCPFCGANPCRIAEKREVVNTETGEAISSNIGITYWKHPETPDCVLGFGMFFLDTPDDIQRWNSRTDKAKSNPET